MTMPIHRILALWALGLAALVAAPRAFAQESPAAPSFERAFYLQQHEGNLQAAAAAYEQALADGALSADLRREAERRLAECREDLAAADLARLMPAGALVYAELNQPGDHVARLAEMAGLVRTAEAKAAGDALAKTGEPLPLGPGVVFPRDFAISPALLESLKPVRGVAVAMTSLPRHGPPSGLVVIHPGDASLLRGIVETAAQFLQPAEPIAGHKTYRLGHGGPEQAWLAVTARLLVLSFDRAELTAAIERLGASSSESLATQSEFNRVQGDRENALLFVHVNGPRMRAALKEVNGGEAPQLNAALDLDHLEGLTAALRTTSDNVNLEVKLTLTAGQRNLVYSLIRTAPLSQRSLAHVPQGSALVALLGLNPAGPAVEHGSPSASDAPPQAVAAMDLGRELFGNLEELAFFVAPSDQPGLPHMGVVLSVRDAAKSEALWGQLLALPALFAPQVPPPRDVTIEGRPGKQYLFPDAPPLALVRLEGSAIAAGTEAAMAAVARTGEGNRLTNDAQFQPLLSSLTPDSSKAVLVHVGRMLKVAGAMDRGRDGPQMARVGELLDRLAVVIVTQEGPTELVLQAAVSGLPNVPKLVEALSAPRGARAEISVATPPDVRP